MKGWMNEMRRLTNGKSSVTKHWKQLGKRWNSKWGGMSECGADNTELQEGGRR